MNFSPFGGHFPTSIPTIHQFAAKFNHDNSGNSLCPPQDTSTNRYTANGVPSFTQHHPAPPQQQHLMNSKYQNTSYLNQNAVYTHQATIRHDKRQTYDQQELAQELCAAMLQQQTISNQQQQDKQQQNTEKIKQEVQDERRNQQVQHQQQQQQAQNQQQQNAHQQQQVQTSQQQNNQNQTITSAASMPTTWQSLAAPGSTVADYLSHLPASTLPLSLHHFLKYSAETMKKENVQQLNIQNADTNLNLLHPTASNGLTTNLNANTLGVNAGVLGPSALTTLNTLSTINTAQLQTAPATTAKKKKKKKPEKEKKPRPKPGEIRLTTALDGSTLYCCPECHMAYPEKELLEQHLVGHTLERRFVCDICGAGLKRKDHLTRHKQSHNPERPYVCTVCLKAFKRKEQLTLHFVIHSGEKRHICTECGKGFYRKDHLRKHTRSHIARRVKAELSQQSNTGTASLQVQVAAPIPPPSNNGGQGETRSVSHTDDIQSRPGPM